MVVLEFVADNIKANQDVLLVKIRRAAIVLVGEFISLHVAVGRDPMEVDTVRRSVDGVPEFSSGLACELFFLRT